ncbi:zinc finger protein OZF-like [Chironomus tepperi]|uniref:zinc finger protein OZF-like n=1 Tax=Chironomus tepperi TaxID=113505 RepID=UPI00391F2D89
MTTCYICGNLSTEYVNIPGVRAQHSGKMLRELVESISGYMIEMSDIICNFCVQKLNDFDKFSLKAEQIQSELKMLMHNKIYIKQEPKEELDDVSIGSYETEMNTDNEDAVNEVVSTDVDKKPVNMSAHFDWNSTKDNEELKKRNLSMFEDLKSRPKKRIKNEKSQKTTPKKKKNDVVYQCTFPPCDRRFPTKTRLLNHLQLHSTDRPFQCSFCGKFYKTKDCLRSHQRVVHRNADLRVICDTCGLAFTRKPSLERHYKAAHLKLRSFICTLCGYSYCNASSLQAHSFVHNKDNKNFVCEICDARFHTRSKLNRHMRCHGEKEFECPVCHRKYSQRYNLTAHMKQVHEEYQILKPEQAQPIVCQLCGRVFDRQKTLQKHLKNVHEACPINVSME